VKRFVFGAFIVILLWILPVYGEEQPFSSDEVVLPPSLADQHGRMHEIDAQLQTLCSRRIGRREKLYMGCWRDGERLI